MRRIRSAGCCARAASGRYAAKYKNKFSPPNGDCHVTLSRIWLPLYLIFS